MTLMPVSLVCVVLCVVLVGKQQSAPMVPVWVQTLCFQSQMCQGFRLLLPVTVWHHSPVDPYTRYLSVLMALEPRPQTAQCSGLVFARALQEAMRRPGSFPGQKVPGSALGLDTVGLTAQPEDEPWSLEASGGGRK